MKLTRSRAIQVILLLSSVGLVAQAAASTPSSSAGTGAGSPTDHLTDVTDQTADAATSVVTTATGYVRKPEAH